jgi:GT2 family glycosyltransferase
MPSAASPAGSAVVLSGDAIEAIRTSVIVPTFERLEPLRALLDSLVAQRLRTGVFEVVISDDGSGPGVLELAKELAPRFSRLVFVHGPNAGPGVARNRGVRQAQSGVLVFVDSDCIVDEDWLDQLTTAVERGATLAHGPVMSEMPAYEPFVHSIQANGGAIPGANVAIARSAFEAVRGFRPEVSRIAEDHDLVQRLRKAGCQPTFVPDARVHHPPRIKRISFKLVPDEGLVRMYRELVSFYETCPESRPGFAATNRRLGMKAILKALLAVLPLLLLAGVWRWTGLAVLALIPFAKWARANQLLRRGGEAARVPFVEAIRYALAFPIQDVVTLAQRARFGLAFWR